MKVISVTDTTPHDMEKKIIEVVLAHEKGLSMHKITVNTMTDFSELVFSSGPSPEEMLAESATLEAIKYCHERIKISDEAKDFLLRYTSANSDDVFEIVAENIRKVAEKSVTPAEIEAVLYIYRAWAISTLAMRRQIFFGGKSFFNI